jgi:hypothetical protein
MAVKQKVITKVPKELKTLVLSNKNINEKALQEIGIDTRIKSQEFGNIRIKYDSWNGVSIDVVDNKRDLDGNLIAENKKLTARLKNLFENKTRKIKAAELSEFNIWKPSKELVFGNLKIRDHSDFLIKYDYYELYIIDEKKNTDGLWLDSAITYDRIADVLKHFDLSVKELAKKKELDLNKDLEILLKQHFETVKKGGRSNQGDIDLIIGSNHNYGIEIKLAREISKAAACQKAIGQIELYTRQFKGNFMVLIAGLPSEKNDKSVAEVIRKAKDCNCKCYYLEAH